MGPLRACASPAFKVSLQHAAYRFGEVLNTVHTYKVQVAGSGVFECGIQLAFGRARDNLMNFWNPARATTFECCQYLEYSDRDNVRAVQVIEGPSIELFCRGNTYSPKLIERALPGPTYDLDNMDRSRGLS
jgi:hypothetical protein